MTNEDLYNLTLTILRKEGRGNIIKPERFTWLLRQCHLEYFNQQYEKFAVSQTISDSLRPFHVGEDEVTFGSGTVALSSLTKSYFHMVSARVSATNNRVDIVMPMEWDERIDDELTQPTVTDPIMGIGETELRILPDSITDVKLSYLKLADEDPFFDYYIDAQRNVQWMGVFGTQYTLQAGEVYRDGTTSPTQVESINRELEWGDQDKVNILSMILEKIGVSLSADIAQYAMAKEQQQNVA
jgi:hypothetical protein